MSIADRIAGLDPIGTGGDGVMRLAWTPEDAACRQWFARQADELGLSVLTDPAGNLWACPDSPAPWWAVGSHLDSVRGGGRFDGPLGVACGFELAAEHPIAVLAFADEEGARFNTPTFGSKALAGRLDLPGVLGRTDDAGVRLADAIAGAGVDPDAIAQAPAWLAKLAGFVEIHIDQSRELALAGVPVGVVSRLANRMRLELEFCGRADHAGTTPRDDRQDALSAAARAIVAGEDLGAGSRQLTVTASRILATPNASTTIASHVRLWIDARSPDRDELERWLQALRAALDGLSVPVRATIASRSDGQEFSGPLRAALRRAGTELTGAPVPEVVCFAGHDAGVVASQVPAAMVLVRNPTGVSHSPAENVELADAQVAVEVVGRALRSVA